MIAFRKSPCSSFIRGRLWSLMQSQFSATSSVESASGSGVAAAAVNATMQTVSKYSESYKMSQDEVNSILKKKSKKQKSTMVFAAEINAEDASYSKDINETLKEIAAQKSSNQQVDSTGSLGDITTRFNEENSAQQSSVSRMNANGLPTTGLQGETRVAIKYYKHKLPIPNVDPELVGAVDPFERAQKEYETSNQRLWALLNLTENTPYEAYELSLRHKFNNELDMYGDIQDEAAVRSEQQTAMGDGAVPMFHLNNVEYMERMRRQLTVNFNMPGAIELEHPHKFLRDLRPIEEFRHTPLIPISERQMREHQQKVEALSRRGFYFEIKKDTVYNAILAAIAMSIGFYMITLVLKKEEESGIAVERLKIERANIGIQRRQ